MACLELHVNYRAVCEHAIEEQRWCWKAYMVLVLSSEASIIVLSRLRCPYLLWEHKFEASYNLLQQITYKFLLLWGCEFIILGEVHNLFQGLWIQQFASQVRNHAQDMARSRAAIVSGEYCTWCTICIRKAVHSNPLSSQKAVSSHIYCLPSMWHQWNCTMSDD